MMRLRLQMGAQTSVRSAKVESGFAFWRTPETI